MDDPEWPVHHTHMAKNTVVSRLKKDPPYGKTHIRAWRKHRGLSLETLAERVGVSHGSLSRIERGRQPYAQRLLERLAEELQADPASLLIRDPTDPDGIWSVWEQAKPGQKNQILEVAKTLIKTGT